MDARYESAKALCATLGGQMGMDARNIQHTIGDIKQCSWKGDNGDTLGTKYWIPVVQGELVDAVDDKYQWHYDYNLTLVDSPPWNTWDNQPNGGSFEKCTTAYQYFSGEIVWGDKECMGRLCFVCELPQVETFRLRGPPGPFDQKYYLSWNLQSNETKVEFLGQNSGQIVWFPMKHSFRLTSQMNTTTLSFVQDPFGHLMANKSTGGNVNLLGMEWIFTKVSIISIYEFV